VGVGGIPSVSGGVGTVPVETGCRGIQPAVVVAPFTANALGAQLVVADGERAKLHCKIHHSFGCTSWRL
jgi:hypothetical protein